MSRSLAVGIIQFVSDGKSSVSQKMQRLNRNIVYRNGRNFRRMTANSTRSQLFKVCGENEFTGVLPLRRLFIPVERCMLLNTVRIWWVLHEQNYES